MSQRKAIAYNLVVVAAIIFVIGIIWIGLYYGGILPVYNSITGTYGAGIFDSSTITFVLAFCAWWMFMCTVAVIWWLWQRSQKRGYYEG